MENTIALEIPFNWFERITNGVYDLFRKGYEKAEKYSRSTLKYIYGSDWESSSDFSEKREINDDYNPDLENLLFSEEIDVSSIWRGHRELEKKISQFREKLGVYTDYSINNGKAKIRAYLNPELINRSLDYIERKEDVKFELNVLTKKIRKTKKTMNQGDRIDAVEDLSYRCRDREEVTVEYFMDGEKHEITGKLYNVDGYSGIKLRDSNGKKLYLDFVKNGGIRKIMMKSPSENGEGSVLLYNNQWIGQKNISEEIIRRNTFGKNYM